MLSLTKDSGNIEQKEPLPRWHRELDIFRKIKPVLILEGNVLDKYVFHLDAEPGRGAPVSCISEYLHYYFKAAGYENIILYDEIHGFTNRFEEGYLERFAQMVGARAVRDAIPAEFVGKNGTAATYVDAAMTQTESPTVILMDFASRYIPDPSNLRQPEVEGFTILQQTSLVAGQVHTPDGFLNNMLVLLVNKLNDIPAWFYLTNPNVKAITIPTPTKEERASIIKGDRFRSFFDPRLYAE